MNYAMQGNPLGDITHARFSINIFDRGFMKMLLDSEGIQYNVRGWFPVRFMLIGPRDNVDRVMGRVKRWMDCNGY